MPYYLFLPNFFFPKRSSYPLLQTQAEVGRLLTRNLVTSSFCMLLNAWKNPGKLRGLVNILFPSKFKVVEGNFCGSGKRVQVSCQFKHQPKLRSFQSSNHILMNLLTRIIIFITNLLIISSYFFDMAPVTSPSLNLIIMQLSKTQNVFQQSRKELITTMSIVK